MSKKISEEQQKEMFLIILHRVRDDLNYFHSRNDMGAVCFMSGLASSLDFSAQLFPVFNRDNSNCFHERLFFMARCVYKQLHNSVFDNHSLFLANFLFAVNCYISESELNPVLDSTGDDASKGEGGVPDSVSNKLVSVITRIDIKLKKSALFYFWTFSPSWLAYHKKGFANALKGKEDLYFRRAFRGNKLGAAGWLRSHPRLA